ncbi:hypothetical protein CPB97_008363 [Podila verticillata]|nr:hypothetical protein CPB97_008363 [Podila verticillata]
MDVKIVSSITRLANYMPLGSYVIYTALETYSFSLGATPAPVTTIVQSPTGNYTCYYNPGAAFTYTTCTTDQASALKVSLAIGFFLAMFLSFLKQVPQNGTPPLAFPDENALPSTPDEIAKENRLIAEGLRRPRQPKYRAGIVYAQGNFYYLDFGDFRIWGHAALSVVAFGTLSLFSASVSTCLFPQIRPWIFVFTQVILLVICCFIAMFWIDDPSLSIGLMVVPPATTNVTQTSYAIVNTGTGTAAVSAMVLSSSSSSAAVVGATGDGGGGPVSRMGAISKRILNKASASFGRKSKNPTRAGNENEGDDSVEYAGNLSRVEKEELEAELNGSELGSTITRPEAARSSQDRKQDESDPPGHIAVKME